MPLNLTPQLWVVATPLGNPGDLSPRAREVLEAADTILAEDTSRAGLLCKWCAVKAKRFSSLHDHNEDARLAEIIRRLQAGESMALISDAGLPLISDPGFRLVRACRKNGLRVSVVPGPSAPLTALAGSGIAPLPFVFMGFLPRAKGDIVKAFAQFTYIAVTLVFFERKDRLESTLQIAKATLGNREVCVARELTKTYEEYILGDLDSVEPFLNLLGEITVIIGPPENSGRSTLSEARNVLAEEYAQSGTPRQIVKRAHARLRGWSTAEIYDLLVARQKQG
jgi:16S rRNA (cytidine1402-2'-O)-methyltransferase